MRTCMKAMHSLFAVSAMVCFSLVASADPPGPPVEHGANTNQGGPAGAPIDGGLGILLTLGAVYGIKKIYKARKDSEEPLSQ